MASECSKAAIKLLYVAIIHTLYRAVLLPQNTISLHCCAVRTLQGVTGCSNSNAYAAQAKINNASALATLRTAQNLMYNKAACLLIRLLGDTII